MNKSADKRVVALHRHLVRGDAPPVGLAANPIDPEDWVERGVAEEEHTFGLHVSHRPSQHVR